MTAEFNFLMSFKEGEELSEFWLIAKFGEEAVKEMERKKYIRKSVNKTAFGEARFYITDNGIKARDQRNN